MIMRVEFFKDDEGRLCRWVATPPHRRPTRPGRAIVRAHHAALVAAEAAVNGHHAAWRRGDATPVGAALDGILARWLALPRGASLVLDWPIRPLAVPVRAASPRRPSRPAAASGVRPHRGLA